jgi:hypothetical protein
MKKWQILMVYVLVFLGGLGLCIAQTAKNDTVKNCSGDTYSKFWLFENDDAGNYKMRLNSFTQPSLGEVSGNTFGQMSYFPFGNSANTSFQYTWRDLNSSFVSNFASVLIRTMPKNLALDGVYTASQNWGACHITSTGKYISGTYNLDANSITFLPGAELNAGTTITARNIR